MKCEWEQIRPRVWQCRACNRVIAAGMDPDGRISEPRWDRMPNCPGPKIPRELLAICEGCQKYRGPQDDRCDAFSAGCDAVERRAAVLRSGQCRYRRPKVMETLQSMFERVYCINLDRRPDRWKQFIDSLPADWPFKRPERWPAVDGKKCPPPAWWNQGGGAWGCYRTHTQIIEHCLNNDIDSVLILEDDALFHEKFAEKVIGYLTELPSQDGMIYLGGQHLFTRTNPPTRLNELVYRPYNINRTHAYGLRGTDVIQKVYRHLNACRIWQPKHHIDHHYGRLHMEQQIPVYCPAEWLVGQRQGRSNIAGRDYDSPRFWASASILLQDKAMELLPVVAVVGPFRSGTSCVAGVLHQLGISMGWQFQPPESTQRFNPKGTFEAVWLARMCRRFFKEPQMIEQVPQPQRVAELRRWAEGRTRQLGPGKLIGAKHPTLCLMVDDMVQAWPKLRIVAVDRPVEHAIQSGLKLSWLPTAKRVIPMMRQARDTALAHANVPILRIDYYDLLADPQAAIHRLMEFCQIQPAREQIEEAVAFVDPHLCHAK